MVQPILLGTSSSSSPAGLQWEQDQHLHQRCHSCCHDNRILPPRHRCSPPLLQSPDSGMQPLSSSFYLLPTCSRLHQNDNLLGVPQVPGCIWTRLICIRVDREVGLLRVYRTAEQVADLLRGLSAWQG